MAHWYQPDGTLIAQVPFKDVKRAGEMKDTTLRDARELRLLPSVTTVLQLLDKPQLSRWKQEQALEAVFSGLAHSKQEAIDHVDKIGTDAADLGTAIHYGVSCGLGGVEPFYGSILVRQVVRPIVEGFMNQWYPVSGLRCDKSEHTVVHSELGYAGTIDFLGWLNGVPIIGDFKTRDFTELDESRKSAFWYDEYPLQLAGYDLALEDPALARERWSFVISRQVPGLVAARKWDEETKWPNSRGNRAWLSLFDTWQHLNNYYPMEVLS